jgi:hypothetical protein
MAQKRYGLSCDKLKKKVIFSWDGICVIKNTLRGASRPTPLLSESQPSTIRAKASPGTDFSVKSGRITLERATASMVELEVQNLKLVIDSVK